MSERKAKKCCHPNFVAVDKHKNSRFIGGDSRLSPHYQLSCIKRENPGCEVFEVPCGHCAICKSKRLFKWRSSLLAENLTAETSSFYTLTFSDEYLPESLEAAKKLYQKFIKRLRSDGLEFKYFAVSEFGDITSRLHFHALFFGLPPHLQEIKDEWYFGFVDSDVCSIGSIHYLVDYMLKQNGLVLYSKALGYKYFDSVKSDDSVASVYGESMIFPRRYYIKKYCSEKFQNKLISNAKELKSYSYEELNFINQSMFKSMKRKGLL